MTTPAIDPAMDPTEAPGRPWVEIFTEYVVKIHSRCDLACDYCYMYRPENRVWRTRPHIMAPKTVERLAARIAEHVSGRGEGAVNLVLHGGEPLLAGPGVLRRVVESVRAAVPERRVTAAIQTNGALLRPRHVELFAELGVGVGISLDGPADVHDRHRRDRSGRGSHEAAVRAVELVRTVPGLFSGLLSVIDVAADPVSTYRFLADLGPPAIDLLLPHATWAQPPPRRVGVDAEYGAWLAAVFEYWYDERGSGPAVRLFDEILVGLLGGPSAVELVGLSPAATVVIETDGSIEQVDSLKIVAPDASATGLDVFANSFDEAWRHPAFRGRRIGLAGLSAQCRACSVVGVCGGGFHPHRFSEQTGFGNPSVYCADLFCLITRIRARVLRSLHRASMTGST